MYAALTQATESGRRRQPCRKSGSGRSKSPNCTYVTGSPSRWQRQYHHPRHVPPLPVTAAGPQIAGQLHRLCRRSDSCPHAVPSRTQPQSLPHNLGKNKLTAVRSLRKPMWQQLQILDFSTSSETQTKTTSPRLAACRKQEPRGWRAWGLVTRRPSGSSTIWSSFLSSRPSRWTSSVPIVWRSPAGWAAEAEDGKADERQMDEAHDRPSAVTQVVRDSSHFAQ